MKAFLFILVYLLIGFVISIFDSVRHNLKYTDTDVFLMCFGWIIIAPLYLMILLCENLTKIHNTISTKIYKWIKAKNERRFD